MKLYLVDLNYNSIMAQPNYIYMNEQIDFIDTTMETASTLYGKLYTQDAVTFEQYEELQALYDDITDAITEYFTYITTVGIPVETSYLHEWLYGKYYRAEMIHEISAFLEELTAQAEINAAEEMSAVLNNGSEENNVH